MFNLAQKSSIILIAFILLAASPVSLFAQGEEEPLLITAAVHYALPDGDGPVKVSANLHFVNQNPKTKKKSRGRIFFYNEIPVPISPAATNIKAIRGNGKKLRTNRKATNKGFDILTINFGRRLHYNQKMTIDLTYNLDGITKPHDYVSENTILITAFLLGDVGAVSASIPESADYDLDLSSFRCQLHQKADETAVQCPEMNDFAYAFTLEAVKPAAEKVLTSKPIALKNMDLTVEIMYREGEIAWAKKVRNTLRKTLPLLETINGFPYDGPATLTIRQASLEELDGYDGRYEPDENLILLAYGVSRNTIVHEAAHMWPEPYEQRWLLEGWAEWSAREAIRRAKMKPEESRAKLADFQGEDLPLDEWDYLSEIDSESEDALTGFGYSKSAIFISQLVKKIGLKPLQKINQSFLDDGTGRIAPADSESYLQAIRDAGFKVENLWAEFVYD